MTVSIVTEDENGNLIEVPMPPTPHCDDLASTDDISQLQKVSDQTSEVHSDSPRDPHGDNRVQ